jgi:hypothetical protein
VIQISLAKGRRVIAVFDYAVEPDFAGKENGVGPSGFSIDYRARRVGERILTAGEKWSLSADGLGLVMRRQGEGAGRRSQLLYYRRAEPQWMPEKP